MTVDEAPVRGVRPDAPRVDVDGVGFHAVTEQQVLDRVFDDLSTGVGGFVVTPNVDILRQLRRPRLKAITDRAHLVVADGMPVVWASRLAANPLPGRVTGSSLLMTISARAARSGRTTFLLGGDPGIAERAADRLSEDNPGLRVAGWHFPPFGFQDDDQQMAAIRQCLTAANPDIVFVGLGFPKQEHLILDLHESFPAIWFVGCGGGLTMAAGEVGRAPEWAQRSGLEWVHRLVKEPRRLIGRYLVHDAPYAAGLLVRSLASRFRPVASR